MKPSNGAIILAVGLELLLSPTSGTSGQQSHPDAPGLSPAAAQAVKVVNFELRDIQGCPTPSRWCILPAEYSLDPGTELRIRVSNNGTIQHNFTVGAPFNQKIVEVFSPGQARWLNFTVTQSQEAFYWCAVPGHREQGMEGIMIVGGNHPSGSGPPEIPVSRHTIIATIALGAVVLAVYHVRAVQRTRKRERPRSQMPFPPSRP
jgi:uncharacterized cupredoxin-like copper-binding protein